MRREQPQAVAHGEQANTQVSGHTRKCEDSCRRGRTTARLQADATLFRRALSNLVSNALRHTPPGGQVTLSARQDGGSTLVTVRDTGPGIAPEHLPRIFDRFYRPDRMSLHNPDGTGLGLAIVKSIMDLHRGSVTVSSDPARGTLFTLQFPPGDPETH